MSMPRTGSACKLLPPILRQTSTDACAAVREALNILGIRCFHGFDLWHTPPELYGLWLDVVRAKYPSDDNHSREPPDKAVHCQRETWDRLLGDFGGASDAPCISFPDELRLVYPEAKVILVERDPDTWLESFMEVVGNELGGPTLTLMARCVHPYPAQKTCQSLTASSIGWTHGSWVPSSKSCGHPPRACLGACRRSISGRMPSECTKSTTPM